jgi:hypothetical protein
MKPVRLLAFALMLVLGLLALSTPAQASNLSQKGTVVVPTDDCMPGTVVSSPNVLGRNELFGLDAISANDAWTVGTYYSPTINALLTLTEHWDGTRWTHVASPNGPGANGTSNQLSAVSAVSANDVWAVGSYGAISPFGALALHWNGTEWTSLPVPNPGSTGFSEHLNGVFAISSNDVWAVGDYRTESASHALTVHWDGTQWTQVAIPSDPEYNLYAVTAISSTDVWAVGGGPETSGIPTILHWNGTAWTDFSGVGTGTLVSVDAVSANDVWAVGSTGPGFSSNQMIIMHWNGTEWSIVPGPGVDVNVNVLTGVSARAANDVWAVGWTSTSITSDYSTSETLIIHWNGTKWSVVENPAAVTGRLYAVDALSASNVWAAGAHINPKTLLEQWDGSQWTQAPSEDPGLATNVLLAVDALSTTDVWAVGTRFSYGPRYGIQPTLIEHWDGYSWSVIPSPNGSNNENLLQSVDAIAANDVWAVGMTGDGGDFWTLTEHWDGTTWSVVPSPNPNTIQPKYLQSVSAVNTDDVWAVGFQFGFGDLPTQTFIIHWNGDEWSVVPSPNVGTNGSELYGVTAISANDAWAVGNYHTDTFGVYAPLFLHWDGAEWSHVPGPAVSNSILTSISAVSSNDVWAVGTDAFSSASHTVTMHWDGTEWSVVPSPNFGESGNRLTSVSAVAPDDVWAAGDFTGGTLIEHWDGAAWSITYIATPGLLDNRLSSISALSGNDVWAVGTHSAGAPNHTLVEHIGRFNDVMPSDYFFTPVNYLVEHGAISGYDDCTFRPGNDTTRGQLSKIVTLAQGWTLLDPPNPTFTDVAPGSTFYRYVETMYARGLIGGYPCGAEGEPCDDQERPYFRPNAPVTRGQITKIVVLAKGWTLKDPGNPTFADVESGSTFYTYIETASAHGIINGYGCGGQGEPCDGENRPYFRPSFSATRGQIAKIVYNAVTQP